MTELLLALLAGAFGLLGVLVGGIITFEAQNREYDRAMRAAGRAVCLEMMQNATYLRAGLDGMPVSPPSRQVFDRELDLLASLLNPDAFRVVTAPYLKLTAVVDILRPFIDSHARLSGETPIEVAAQAEADFGAGAATLAALVWSEVERRQLSAPRN